MTKVITEHRKIDELLTRGVEEVIVKDHLREILLSGKKLRVKLGNDPTSPNIHVGRATLLWKLKAFQELGHTAVFIVGDFTGLIGDTSDKGSERPMLSEAEIDKNVKTYFSQAFKILDEKKTETHFNSKWLRKINFKEIGELADMFGLHEFEARENIAKRMRVGKRVSLREVLYPLMQGYDSVAVKADVELGGTDQKFNLLAGRVIQPHYHKEAQDIMTMKLLEGLDGRKMSSSWGNVINITDAPDDIFGKVMSLKDELIERYFVLATGVDEADIKSVLARGPRDAKFELAKTIVGIYHDAGAAEKAGKEFNTVFVKKEKPEDMPVVKIKTKELPLAELLVEAKLVSSKSEARRLIGQGGVRIDDVKKMDPKEKVNLGKEIVIQVGPRKFLRVSG